MTEDRGKDDPRLGRQLGSGGERAREPVSSETPMGCPTEDDRERPTRGRTVGRIHSQMGLEALGQEGTG